MIQTASQLDPTYRMFVDQLLRQGSARPMSNSFYVSRHYDGSFRRIAKFAKKQITSGATRTEKILFELVYEFRFDFLFLGELTRMQTV